MNCPKCGNPILENTDICPHCGIKLNQNIESENISQNINNPVDPEMLNSIEPETLNPIEPVAINNNAELKTKKNFFTSILQKLKANKKLSIIIGSVILAVILIVVIIVILLSNNAKNNKFEDPFDDIDTLSIANKTTGSTRKVTAAEISTNKCLLTKLDNSIELGNITKDEYIMQLAYAIYEPDKVNKIYKYETLDCIEPKILIDRFSSMLNEVSNETITYVLKKITLSDVVWDVPEDSKAKDTSINQSDYNIQQLSDKNTDVRKLDKVLLSSKGNFLIYYTNDGANAITDDKAQTIAKTLESTVSQYKKQFKLDFRYDIVHDIGKYSSPVTTFIDCAGAKEAKACKLLRKNKIDTKYIKTAMPVYIIDTDSENTNIGGFYFPASSGIDNILEQTAANIAAVTGKLENYEESAQTALETYLTTYAFPYFVVNSKAVSDNTKIIAGHELFHHYQRYICGDGKYAECSSGNFTIETTANLASARTSGVNTISTSLSNHAAAQIRDVESSIDIIGKRWDDDVIGYGSFVFASNYIDIVKNGSTHMFNSLKTTETLKYLYDNSDGKYEEVLTTTAKKNLTRDYENNLLLAIYDGEIIYPPNHRNIGTYNTKQTENINYSSMHYYYVNPSDYSDKSQISFKSDSDNITLLLFVNENNQYKYLYTQKISNEFVININEFKKYSEVAFAIVDSSISGASKYEYEQNKEGNKTPSVTLESLGLENKKKNQGNYSSIVCYTIDDSSSFQNATQLKISFDKKYKVNDIYLKETIKMKNYDPSNPAFSIAKQTMNSMIYLLQQKYKEAFKYFKIKTAETDDTYSILIRVTKEYEEALSKTFKLDTKSIEKMVEELTAEGFTCTYEK